MADKKVSGYCIADLKEIDNTSHFAVTKENELTKIANEVGEMGLLQLFWDSKTPENEKGILNFISFKVSDPDVVKAGIGKYKKFYAQMRVIMRVVRSEGKGSCEDVDNLIQDLNEKLMEMAEEAECGKRSTDSKTLFELHTEFVKKHQKLENMIRRVESIALRQKQTKLMKDLQKAMKLVEELTREVRDVKKDKEEMKIYVKDLKKENTEWKKRNEVTLHDTKETLKLLEVKQKENEKLMREQEKMLEENRVNKALLEKLIFEKK